MDHYLLTWSPARRTGFFFVVLVVSVLTLNPLSFAEEKTSTLLQDVGSLLQKPFSAEPVVVTASRIEQPYSTVTVPYSVVTEQDIRDRKHPDAIEYLRTVPGLRVNTSGGRGRTTDILIRGANANHTLVMVDGVKVNSPTTGVFNFNSLSSDFIERIEVVRGPQAALYGSDTIGGVVNVITKKGEGLSSYTGQAEFGGNTTFNESGTLQGSWDRVNIGASVSRYDTEGRSLGDEYDATNAAVRAGVKVTDWLDWDTNFRYNKSFVEIDDGPLRVDPNRYSREKNDIFSTRLHGPWEFDSHWINLWNQSLQFSFYHNGLLSVDPPDADTAQADSRFKLDANIYNLHYHSAVTLFEFMTVTVGAEWEKQMANNKSFKRQYRNTGYYVMDQFSFWDDRWLVDVGLRYEDNSEFGHDINPQVNQSYHLKELGSRIKASYGTGFRAPTFNQLFFPNFGNPALEPEESKSYSASWLQELGAKGTFEIGAYHTAIKNLIGFQLVGQNFQAVNFGKAKLDGLETETRWDFNEHLQLSLRYDFLYTRDKEVNGKELVRRPKHSGSATMRMKFDPLTVYASWAIVGARKDRVGFGFPFRQANSGYEKLDLTVTYQWNEDAQIFGRVENVTSRFYSDVIGFPNDGALLFVGLRMNGGLGELTKMASPITNPLKSLGNALGNIASPITKPVGDVISYYMEGT